MKIKSMLVAAMAAMALVACNKDPKGEGGEVLTGEATYAKITLTQQDVAGRANGDAINPVASESAISTATLYVFGPANMLENIVPLSFTSGTWNATFKTTTGNHKFYALVNVDGLPAGIQTIIAGFGTAASPNTALSLSSFERTVLGTFTSVDQLTTASKFFMTNVATPSAMNLVKGGSELAPPNSVTIQVGRAVAKIALSFNVPAEANTVDETGVLNNVTYKMKALPKAMYTMPVYTAGAFSTPYHTSAYSAAEYMAWSSTAAPFDATSYLAALTGAFDKVNETKVGYIMENSNNKAVGGKAMQGKTTYAVIRGTFTPKTTVDDMGINPSAGVPAADFWRIATIDGGGKPLVYDAPFYRVIPDASLVTAGKAAFKYEAGKAYYPFWITDTYNNANTDPEKYFIHRNNYHLVNIVSVSGCGANDEDNTIIDPTDPVEEDAWVKGTLEILPWVEINQQGGI